MGRRKKAADDAVKHDAVKPTVWDVQITQSCLDLLQDITDRRVREKILERIDELKQDPDLQGKPLCGELKDFRSVRAVGQRYRIIYSADQGQVMVLVVAAGIRKEGDRHDIYALAQRLLKLGLLSE